MDKSRGPFRRREAITLVILGPHLAMGPPFAPPMDQRVCIRRGMNQVITVVTHVDLVIATPNAVDMAMKMNLVHPVTNHLKRDVRPLHPPRKWITTNVPCGGTTSPDV
jgi:hypothetical protein